MDSDSEKMLTWELRRGDVILATLAEYDRDFPWVFCHFKSSKAFEPFRHFFIRDDGRWRGRVDHLHTEIDREGIYLMTTDGHRAPAFTLSLVGEEARLTFTPL